MSPQPNAAVGAPLSRVDGRLKVTDGADYDIEGVAHGVIVDASVGRGRLTGIDTGAAEAHPGVLKVVSHRNAPTLAYRDNPGSNNPAGGRRLRVFQDDQVLFHGQPVAVVVASTLEAAQHAASLVEVTYDAQTPATHLSDDDAQTNTPLTYARGDAQAALAAADVRMEMTYRLARSHHNPMEPHATIARWDGDLLTVWDETQWVIGGTQTELAAVFGIPVASVRVISPFVGGAFGSGLRTWPHVTVAALAARETGRPVKVVLSRRQQYFGTGFRPAYEYQVQLGNGRVSAMTHTIRSETSAYEPYGEQVLPVGQHLYSTPNVGQTYRTVRLDVNTPVPMRGPATATASIAVESAMDELSYRLGIDPIELRLGNEPETDPANRNAFSTRRLRECYTTGAREFDWNRRNPKPRSTRDGDWLIGTGMAAVSWVQAGGLERRGSDRRSADAGPEGPRRRQLTANTSPTHLNTPDGQGGARSASPDGRPDPVSRERSPASGPFPVTPWETDGRKIFPIKASQGTWRLSKARYWDRIEAGRDADRVLRRRNR